MELTKNQAKSIASFINVASGKSDAVMALQGVKVVVVNGIATVYSTNRMVIAKQTFEIESDDVEVVLPPEVLKFLKTATGSVSIEVSDEGKFIVAKSQDGRSMESVAVYPSSYPKIEEFIPDEVQMENRATPIIIDFDLLSAVSKLIAVEDFKNPVNAYEIFIQADNERGKPKPVIAKRNNIVAVIQPRLVK